MKKILKNTEFILKMQHVFFFDDNRLDDFDDFHSDDEDRFKIIGKIRDVLVVIYTEREDRTRIISARLAEKFEKEAYYEQFYY